MLNDLSSPISMLATRRSGKPRDMIAPGPNDGELRTMLKIATRVPDHGKLAPWRFVIVDGEQRERLATLMVDAYRAERPEAGRLEIEAIAAFSHQAPCLVVALSSPTVESKIPVWEQELSCGAAIMALLAAATASGYVGGWLTGWPAYSKDVRDAFGAPHERIAGFVFIGSPARPLEERPRPEYGHVVRKWG